MIYIDSNSACPTDFPNAALTWKIIQDWKNGITDYTLYTSGTTGTPCKHIFSREALIESANNTAEIMQIQSDDSMYIILPVNKTGGFMQVVRALVFNLPIFVAEPAFTPHFTELIKGHISFTPSMLGGLLEINPHFFSENQITSVLVGGAQVHINLIQKLYNIETPVYETYGMTETASNIAYRRINQMKELNADFTLLKGWRVEINTMGNATFFHSLITKKWIDTSDIILKTGLNNFQFLGRSDDVINSAGIKIHPALEEQKLRNNSFLQQVGFLISSIPDSLYGEVCILVCENKYNVNLDEIRKICPHLHIHQLYFLPEIPVNNNGKPNRKKVREIIRMALVP